MASQVLKSESYGNSLLVHLKDLYDRNQFCDFFLTTSTEEFHVHRLILSGVSNYFKSLLCDGGSVDNRFHIQTFDADCVQTVIHFMYTGILVLSQTNIWNILALSSQFEIPDVTDLCQEFLKELTNPGKVPAVAKESAVSAVQQTTRMIALAAEKVRDNQVKTRVSRSKKDELCLGMEDPLLGDGKDIKLEPLDDLMTELVETEGKPDLTDGYEYSDDGELDQDEFVHASDSDPSYQPTTLFSAGYDSGPAVETPTVETRPVADTPPSPAAPQPGPSSARKRGRPRKSQTQTELGSPIDKSELSSSTRKRGRPRKSSKSPTPSKRRCTSMRSTKATPKSVVKKSKSAFVTLTENSGRKVLPIPKLSKRYACTLCSKLFTHLASLHLHRKLCHVTEGHRITRYQHTLAWAGKVQRMKSRCRPSGEEGVFTCTVCKKSVNSTQRLVAHTLKHHRQRTHVYECTNCEPARTFHSPKHLYSHRHRRHRHKTLGTAPLRDHFQKCIFCNRVFMYKKSFQLHQAAVHSAVMAVPEMTWQCTVKGCEVSGTSHLAYMSHMVQVHPGMQFELRKPTKRRKSYNNGFKLQVLNYADTYGKKAAANFFHLDEWNVRKWRKIRHTLEAFPEGKARNTGLYSKFPELEQRVVEWLKPFVEDEVTLTNSLIQMKAKEVAIELGLEDKFSASSGWVTRVKNRMGLALRPRKNRRPPPAPEGYLCMVCNKTFKTEEYLACHMSVHKPDSKYPCSKCGRVYSRRGTLHQHELMAHGEDNRKPNFVKNNIVV